MAKELRTETIFFRLTPTEMAAVQQRAEEDLLSPAIWVRREIAKIIRDRPDQGAKSA